jgi:CrcB protein
VTGVFLVAAGGALGSVARYLLGIALNGALPWGTLAANIAGSAAIGLVAGWGVQGPMRLFLVPGLLGGFTTFSAFSLEAALLWERAPWMGALYVAASAGLGLAAFAVAYWVAR